MVPQHPVRTKAYNFALAQMFRLRPERIHHLMVAALEIFAKATPVNRAVKKYWAVADPRLSQTVFGVTFPAPLGLAAGFDKNATCADAWGALGFGYAELGTVTAQAQPGNPTPRLFRLPQDKALLNRMGFNNLGAARAAERLRQRKTTDVIGINIGKTKVVPAAEAVADYQTSAQLLDGLADFLVINVSSPNTPGLRDLQATESLRPIISAVKNSTKMPVLVKIAPDLADEDIDAVADLALELGIAGIVATNTTISRTGLATPATTVADLGAGGISGAPLTERSLAVLKRLYDRVGEQLVLIGVGGIRTPQDAWERIGAGATLLQGYTQFIYGGPDWIRDCHLGLIEQLEKHGLTHLSEARGKQLPWLA